MRIVIAENSGLLRAATVRLLVDAGFEIAGQAGDAADLLRKVRAHRPDLAIIAFGLPQDQLDAVCAIRAALPDVGVLLLSQQVDARCAGALLEHGAEGVGYLVRDRVPDVARFIDAIRTVGDGGSVLDPDVLVQLLARPRRNRVLDALSERDRDVLAQIAEGATNDAIARRMFLSERAVERHVTAIFRKLDIACSRHAHRRVLAVLAHLRAA
jgi:DNA-binding NarL/FixJ family response regulator